MIRVSDYVISFLGNAGVKHVFMVSGGGGMYLIDSLGRSEVIQYVCNHHEQASAMSAEGYQRITGNIGVALVTTGPAGTNAITGVMCAWNDSIPMLVLSGQVNSKSLIGDTGLRQRGVHEANITEIVKTITKYAVTVTDVNMIRYHLERGLFLAKNGRPGPVWIDIPLDIQSAMINPLELEGFNNVEACNEIVLQPSVYELETVKELLYNAKRPIILAGHGIKLANAKNEFVRFIEKYSIPVVTTKNAFDLIEDDHFLLAGRIGTYGQRAGNFAVQNSDLVISLGSRLANPTVGYNVEMFAREAKKVVVDIDSNQLKHSTIKVDVTINADVKVFIQKIDSILIEKNSNDFSPWIEKCKEWRKTYPVILPEWKEQKKYVNSYYFFEALSEKMTADDILVTDQGASFYSFTVAFKVKKGQRAFTNGGFSPMGYGLPAAIGACFANEQRQVVCVHGDGGLEMNLQELQTIMYYKLPIKLFVFNNQGYLSIKHTQTAYFDGFFVGSDPSSGVSCPDFIKIAQAYGIESKRIANHSEMNAVIQDVLATPAPVLVEVLLDPLQPFQPRVSSEKKSDGRLVSKPLEDMYPFLDREEIQKQMIIETVEEQ